MDLRTLAKKPNLTKVIIDDEDILKEYNEPIIFYMYDHIDIITYFEFYRSQSQNDSNTFNKVIQKIILDENGQNLLNEGEVLPVDITLSILGKINEVLGKSKTRLSTQEVGKQP